MFLYKRALNEVFFSISFVIQRLTLLEQDFTQVCVSLPGGQVQRAVTTVVRSVHIGTVSDEELHI